MGIRSEIRGVRGLMLKQLAKSRPEYVQAADEIMACPVAATLLRCPEIQDGDGECYELTLEGDKSRNVPVDRAAIAQFMADVITDESLGANESLGITNRGK